MPDDIVIQPERPDEPQVAQLLAALDQHLAGLYAPDANHILGIEALLEPGITFLTARRAGRLLGCGAARRMPAEPATDGVTYGEIKRMFVSPPARGERIGARLLARLEAALRADGFGLALLETGRDQTEAVLLYERAGYTRRAAFGGYPDNGLSYFYAKALR
jgi:putative acetyltransferase